MLKFNQPIRESDTTLLSAFLILKLSNLDGNGAIKPLSFVDIINKVNPKIPFSVSKLSNPFFFKKKQDRFKFTVLNAVLVNKPGDLMDLANSEARVMLLYCTKDEAVDILRAATDLKLTGENYMWIVTQSVLGNLQPASLLPIGMLGESYLVTFF